MGLFNKKSSNKESSMEMPFDRNLRYPPKNTRGSKKSEKRIKAFLNKSDKSKETVVSDSVHQVPVSPMNRPPYDIKYSDTPDGKLQVDFQDNRKNSRLAKDTTRLIVDGRPNIVEGRNLYSCKVSWYDQEDTIAISAGKDIGNRGAYNDILLELDLNLLLRDPNYVYTLMNEVLLVGRVNDNLRFGMEDNPKRPCGNYMGGVCFDPKIGRYRKYFEPDVGVAVHYSPRMQEKRQERKMQKERERQIKIAQNRAKINSLQAENKKLEENMYH